MSDPEMTLFPEDPATQVHEEIAHPIRVVKVAFGGFVKPEMYDVFGDYDLSSVTDSERAWMQPEQLGSILFQSDRRTKFAIDGVVLLPTEYELVARHPVKLIEQAEARSLKDKDVDDTVLATAARSQLHALETKSEAMSSHRASLVEQRGMLSELAKEAKNPGFAHKSPERMTLLLSAAWNEFQNILDVVHIQRGWDDQARERAQAALIHYLTQGSQRDRVGHWQDMIKLADGYLGARLHVFGSRIRTVESLHKEKTTAYVDRFA